MIAQEFKDTILTLLSGNLVDVELEDEDLKAAYEQAKRVFKQRGNDNLTEGAYPLEVKPGVNHYDLSDEDVYGVIADVTGIIRKRGISEAFDDPFAMSTFQEWYSYQSPGRSMFIYDLMQQQLENHRMYRADEAFYKWNRRQRKLTLYNPPTSNETWFVEVLMESTDEEYQSLPWIIDWTLAECKIILGNAYRKFSTLPGPAGEASMSGDQLVQEGQQEKERLLEDIDTFVDGDPDGLGIFIG